MKRLDYILSNAGIGNRSEIKDMIKQGRVTVNGEIIKNPAFKTEENAEILIDKIKVDIDKFIYLMLNKPAGYISTTEKIENSVLSLVPDEYWRKDLFPVGRLDKDTEGLLLITNDGSFSHNITSPKKQITKVYEVTLEKPVKDEDFAAFAQGIILGDGTKCLPAKIEKHEKRDIVLAYIDEGKYHQVKRMFAACANKVTGLKRIQVGEWHLGDLETGKVIKLSVKSRNQE